VNASRSSTRITSSRRSIMAVGAWRWCRGGGLAGQRSERKTNPTGQKLCQQCRPQTNRSSFLVFFLRPALPAWLSSLARRVPLPFEQSTAHAAEQSRAEQWARSLGRRALRRFSPHSSPFLSVCLFFSLFVVFWRERRGWSAPPADWFGRVRLCCACPCCLFSCATVERSA